MMDDDKYWGQDHLHNFFDRKDDPHEKLFFPDTVGFNKK
jgi:hypothetical protein